jgi:hypothetical protein
MDSRQQLEELHLALEGAVDQMTRAQRLASAPGVDLGDLPSRLDGAFGEVVALRNAVRERLMRELARGPKKLPVL